MYIYINYKKIAQKLFEIMQNFAQKKLLLIEKILKLQQNIF